MTHETALLATIAAGLGLAFIFGFLASRLKLPPLVGYLLAGVAVGPFTPGFVADVHLAPQLAEIGVILLMFGVGLHFSVADLIAVRRIAIPGAAVQIVAATVLGVFAARLWGWSWPAGVVFGLCLSVASTVVLLRTFEERGILDTANGRIAVGWLIVEDLVTVLILVLLPAFASLPQGGPAVSLGRVAGTVALTLGKVAVFLGVMHVAGRRLVPGLLRLTARTGSRELFTLGVLATALGVAVGAASIFGVSFAIGAFFAGAVISESDLSHRAAADALPLQDAFAVLFFVSVGMLFDPSILVTRPLHVLLVVLIVVAGKSLAALVIVLAFRLPATTALTVSASLAQIGEFSFILVELGIVLRFLPAESRSLVLAGSLISITLNPFFFNGIEPLSRWLRAHPRLLELLERRAAEPAVAPEAAVVRREGHAVIVGYGRVGGTIGRALTRLSVPFVVVEQDRALFEALRHDGIPSIYGDAARAGILEHANAKTARLLVVATPEYFHGREVIERARGLNPGIRVVIRTHSVSAQRELEALENGRAFMGERELAFGMAHYALVSLGRSDAEADATVEAIRGEAG